MTPGSGTRPVPAQRAAVAGLVGTAIEWYDFSIYGLAAVLVLGPQFFPQSSPLVSTLAGLSTFAVGFLARPFGAVLAGHLADRIGRKRVLVATLLLMGGATTLVGLLPTYTQIGATAPVLLVMLRLVQGLASGGEWGSAVVMTVEHAPEGRRGFYCGFPQLGISAGVALSSLAFLLLGAFTTAEQFTAWGWRIPFLSSAGVALFGLWVRTRLEESPEFVSSALTVDPATWSPLRLLVRHHWRQVVLTAFVFGGLTALAYIAAVWSVGFGTRFGLTAMFMLMTVFVAATLELPAVLWAARLSDRSGPGAGDRCWHRAQRRRSGRHASTDRHKSPGARTARRRARPGRANPVHGPAGAQVAEAFPVAVRASGVSIGMQFGAVLGGGLAPIVATLLLASPVGATGVSVYLVVLLALAGASALALGRLGARRHGDPVPTI